MDEDLEAALTGDRVAFGRIIGRTEATVRSIVLAIVGEVSRSEEVAQEAYLAAWRELPSLRSPEKFDAWLHGIARNLARSACRRRREVPVANAPEVPDNRAPDALGVLMEREDAKLVEDALAALPEDTREALLLYYRTDCSIDEAAGRLGVTVDAMKKRLSRGRERIREDVRERVGRAIALAPAGFVERTLERLPAPTIAAPAAPVTPGLGIGAVAVAAAAVVLVGSVIAVPRGIGGVAAPRSSIEVQTPMALVAETPSMPGMGAREPVGDRSAPRDARVEGEASQSMADPMAAAGDDEDETAEPELEAKMHLSGLFVAQTAHRAAHGRYSEDLREIGWYPGVESPRYVFGFCGGGPRSHTMRAELFDSGGPSSPYSLLGTLPFADPCGALEAAGIDPSRFRATQDTFTAFAIGSLDGDPDVDVWSMSHGKQLVRLRTDRGAPDMP